MKIYRTPNALNAIIPTAEDPRNSERVTVVDLVEKNIDGPGWKVWYRGAGPFRRDQLTETPYEFSEG